MAGNKFRNARKEKKPEEKKEEELSNIPKNSKVVLTKDYEILSKAKEDPKYHSKYAFKQGTVINVLDTIKNMGLMYLKIPMMKNDLTFGYIKAKDSEGNCNFRKYEEKKEQETKDKPNIEKCHSIRLADAKIPNNGSNQKSQEELKCEKNNIEFMDNTVIPFFTNIALNENVEEEQKGTDIRTTLDNLENSNIENENDPFNVELYSPEKKDKLKSEEKKNGTGEKNPYKNPFFLNKTSGSETRTKSIPEIKNKLSEIYLLKKDLKEKLKNGNSSLEPKYEKGFQVILRRLDLNETFSRIFLLFKDIGHIFLRFYDQKNGIDIIMESTCKETPYEKEAINEIQFNAFKKEDLMKFKDFMIVTEEELSAKEDFEKIKEILIKKYKDKNGNINRGKYSILDNCCYHTVEEILILFGKSPDAVKKIRQEIRHEFWLPPKKSLKLYYELKNDDLIY